MSTLDAGAARDLIGPSYREIQGQYARIRIFDGEGAPVTTETEAQLRDVASLPLALSPYCVMPDAHPGRDAVVGSVLPVARAVYPQLLGPDIGCGMLAIPLNFTADKLEEALKGNGKTLRDLRMNIALRVPAGRCQMSSYGQWENPPERVILRIPELRQLDKLPPQVRLCNYEYQLGTLGTGNHFAELAVVDEAYPDIKDEQKPFSDAGQLWIVVHTGSRGLGNAVAGHFTKEATRLAESVGLVQMTRALMGRDQPYPLPQCSPQFGPFMNAHRLCRVYARVSRRIIAESVRLAIQDTTGLDLGPLIDSAAVDVCHNYIEKASIGRVTAFIHRKGASGMRLDQMGVLPGAMGRATFLVRGSGSLDSLESASHGAGRAMGRSEARKNISAEQHLKELGDLETDRSTEFIDETPTAYKDVMSVLDIQERAGIMKRCLRLHALICIKGGDYHGTDPVPAPAYR